VQTPEAMPSNEFEILDFQLYCEVELIQDGQVTHKEIGAIKFNYEFNDVFEFPIRI